MKNFDEFVKDVKENIMEYLPEEYAGADITVQETRKLNEAYTAICVRKEDQVITPSINLDAIYKDYDGSIPSMHHAMEVIADLVQKQPENLEMALFADYDQAKNHLFIRVSSLEQNQDLVDKVPHMIKEDLLITYHIAAEIMEDGMATTMVTNNMLDHFGINGQQLHEDALASSVNLLPANVRSMDEVVRPMMMSEMLNMGMTQEEADAQVDAMMQGNDNPLTVVTNDRTMNGAGVLFYPNMMEELSEKVGGDFYILPSSVHEILILPDNGEVNAQDLKEMVQEVNDTQVEPEDKLTDEVYHFDAKDRVFEKAATYADRLKAKEKASEIVAEKKEYNQKQQMKPKHRSSDMSI